jgi:hypothetical protein
MQENNSQEPAQPQPQVGFPGQNQPKKEGGKFPKWIFAILGVLIIVGIGGFFVFKIAGKDSDTDQLSDQGSSLGTFSTPAPPTSTQTPEPTATPEPAAKSEISIEVLNGTGVAGQASFVKSKLEALGYEDITAGNADSQDEERTVVTFATDVSKTHMDEITELLEKEYEDVSTKKGSLSGDLDVRIVTGKQKGSAATTAKPVSTTKPSATASATPTATPDPTP